MYTGNKLKFNPKTMKILKTVILTFFLSVVCFPLISQKAEKKPKIKSLTVYEEKFDALVSKKLKESEVVYDERGNILEEITYKQGKINKHFRYQYDSDDNKIKEEKLDPSGKVIETSEYRIENGLRVEKVVYDQNKKMKSRKTYQYTLF